MNKIIAAIAAFSMLRAPAGAAAEDAGSAEFANILNDIISEQGVFDGENGVIYASVESFFPYEENLLVCSVNGKVLSCGVYSGGDGAECVDTLKLNIGAAGEETLYTASEDGEARLIISRGGEREAFKMVGESLEKTPETRYYPEREIAAFKNGKARFEEDDERGLYGLLNSLKLDVISSYTYMNKVNVLAPDTLKEITELLGACADLTEFDRDNYDYDRIFKYVLFTHKSFEGLTQISPESSKASDINIVSAEFIDYIMTRILGIEPEHPPVTALTERGFCYRDGEYMYIGGFSADYETEIREITAVHELGGGNYHVVFADIYRENGKEIPEYSYAVLNNDGGGFSLLRLGMGKNLLTEREISKYAPVSGAPAPKWETEENGQTKTVRNNSGAWVLIAAGAFMLSAAAVLALSLRDRNDD